MNVQRTVEFLGRVPLLAPLSQEHLEHIAQVVTERNVHSGDVLCREGDPGDELVVVVAGRAQAERRGSAVGGFGPSDFFGELALLDRGPRSATVTAITDMQLLALPEAEFHDLVDEFPGLAHHLLAVLAMRIRDLTAAG